MAVCASGLQGHEFIDVEPTGGYTASGALSISTTNQRSALNDVTTTSHHRDSDEADAADDDEDDDNSNYGCRAANCCTVRLNVCCDDNDKQVSVSFCTAVYICLQQESQHPLTGQRAANFRRDLGVTLDFN